MIGNSLPKVQHVATVTKLTTAKVFAFPRDWTLKGRKDPTLVPSASRAEVLGIALNGTVPQFPGNQL